MIQCNMMFPSLKAFSQENSLCVVLVNELRWHDSIFAHNNAVSCHIKFTRQFFWFALLLLWDKKKRKVSRPTCSIFMITDDICWFEIFIFESYWVILIKPYKLRQNQWFMFGLHSEMQVKMHVVRSFKKPSSSRKSSFIRFIAVLKKICREYLLG